MTLQIEEGKFYRTRDGFKAGPAMRHSNPSYPWHVGNWTYTNDGRVNIRGESSVDLVAEWTDEPDIFNITEPFGLLDATTQAALKAYDGEIQLYTNEGRWKVTRNPCLYTGTTYRAAPKPERETVNAHIAGYALFKPITLDLVDGKPDLSSIREREATQ